MAAIAACAAAGLLVTYLYLVEGSMSWTGLALTVLPIFPGVLVVRRWNRRDPLFVAVWLRSQRYSKAYQPRAYLYAPLRPPARTL